MEPSGRRATPTWIDAAVTIVIVTVVILGTAHIDEPGSRPTDALAFVCGVGAAASLVLWRRWPVVTTTITTVALFVYTARDYPGGPAFMSGPLALVGLGYIGSRRAALAGAAAVTASVTVGRWIGGGSLGIDELVVVSWAIAAVLVGQALRARGERAAVARERETHRAEQAVADERLRIAQDLHDSVAHAMATINVQSGVAAHLVDRRPEQAREALEAIRIASRDALDELGAILRVLRDHATDLPRQPLAGLDRIDSLIERARADGLAVELVTRGTGDLTEVAHPVSTAAFRVVQEALTNTRRHAGEHAAARVSIELADEGGLTVTVTDDGAGIPPTSSRGTDGTAATDGGFGLIGMRERVESTGGSLSVGPADGRGYRVVADWPPRR